MRAPRGPILICAKQTAYLCASVFAMVLLAGCATERVVLVPEVVTVVETQWREIPGDLTRTQGKTTVPATLTYGEALEAWSRDRAAIDKLNGQLTGIRSLSVGKDDDNGT